MLRHLETVSTPRWIILPSWGAAVAFFIVAAVVFVQSPLMLSSILLTFLFMAMSVFWMGLLLVFDHLKIEVRDYSVSFRFGPFGKRVPSSDISSAEVQRYPWLVYGGWGIRFSTRGRRAYSVPGYPRGVVVRLQDGKSYYVSSGVPEGLLSAINDLISGAPQGELPSVR